MRVIVVGLGAVGAMTCWRLGAMGCDVVALEKFSIDHDLGSSYGESRIVRRVYPDPLYTSLMAESYTLWDELQSAFPHTELIGTCGGLYFGPADSAQLRLAEEALRAARVDYECWTSAQSQRRYPRVHLDADERALFEPSMGYARASVAVCAAAELARRAGAKLCEHAIVTAISETARGSVEVALQSGERFTGDKLVLCAGPWSGPLISKLGVQLPLKVTRQPYCHLKPAQSGFGRDEFPVWIDAAANAYGFPQLGTVPGVKIGLHDRGTETTPDSVGREVTEQDRDAVRSYAARRFPALSPEVVYEKVCLYTNSPDEDFIVGTCPGMESVTLVAGLSGHGFKFAPLLGALAADLATGRGPFRDLSRFRPDRFASGIVQ